MSEIRVKVLTATYGNKGEMRRDICALEHGLRATDDCHVDLPKHLHL